MFFLLICRILVFGAWNSPPKGMLSSMEGTVAIWRPDQSISTFSVAIMHIEEPCAIWCMYLLQHVHPTQPDGVVCRLLPHFFRNRRYPAIESQSRSKLLGMWSCRRSFFNGKCCEGSPSFRACFHQQQVYCHIDGSCVNDGPARSISSNWKPVAFEMAWNVVLPQEPLQW